MAKKFEITILGVNSAYPVHGRHPSCQIVNYEDRLFMIDCGEAAQIQLAKFHIRRNKIEHIFISHMHGDHCYGLPGLVTSFSLQGRNSKLCIHGPKGIEEFLKGVFKISQAFLTFELEIKEYNTEIENHIPLNKSITVKTFPMKHRIPTMGFRFDEKIPEYNVNSDAIKLYGLSIEEIKSVKAGQSIIRNGQNIPLSELILAKHRERSYSYCSDTVYDLDLIPFISNSDLLYHETTYLDNLKELATKRMHSTLGQAIEIAKASNIKKLIIGHYSSRYQEIEIFLKQGLPEFEGLLLGEEGRVYQV